MPDSRPDDLHDRARGALLGLAVGDAVGTTLEFTVKDRGPPLTDMAGGGPFRLKPGEWTDDTSMALALGESLLACDGLDEDHLMRAFCAWAERGEYSHNGRCFDIGNTVRAALSRFRATGNPVAGSTDPSTAGNGSLMRLAPVPIRYCLDAPMRGDVARAQSRTTHGAEEAVEACAAYADLVAEAIRGRPKSEVLTPRDGPWPPKVARALRMETLSWDRSKVRGSGYVIHSLEAALWAVGQATDVRTAILLAANLGEDADTTAAIAGQLAGALWGASGIPAAWLDQLAWRDRITGLADALLGAALRESRP
jgi:ADP-ribosyl-[dinitrogen reductase] hydrolase